MVTRLPAASDPPTELHGLVSPFVTYIHVLAHHYPLDEFISNQGASGAIFLRTFSVPI